MIPKLHYMLQPCLYLFFVCLYTKFFRVLEPSLAHALKPMLP